MMISAHGEGLNRPARSRRGRETGQVAQERKTKVEWAGKVGEEWLDGRVAAGRRGAAAGRPLGGVRSSGSARPRVSGSRGLFERSAK